MAKEPTLATPRDTIYSDAGLPAQPRPQLPAVADQMYRMQSRIVTAQNVAKPRNEVLIRNKLLANAAAAGEKYFYTLPFKTNDGKGGRTYVMGPSIKLCADAARLYGNCEVDCQFVQETDSHFVFNGTFIDYETGYVLHRPFLQRKSQDVGMKDYDRSLDQVFQIAASKATRNVIHRALPELIDAAYEMAKKSLVDRVGKALPENREKVQGFLAEQGIPEARITRIYGKPIERMDAVDLTKLMTQCSSVADGIIDADECWPAEGEGEKRTEPKADGGLSVKTIDPERAAELEAQTKAAADAKKAEPKKVAPKKEAAKPKEEAKDAAPAKTAEPKASEQAAPPAETAKAPEPAKAAEPEPAQEEGEPEILFC